MKKYIRDCNAEDLKKVFETNEKLREEVSQHMLDCADDYIRELLQCWEPRSIDYEISPCCHSYFKARDKDGFIDGLRKAQCMYCFLPDSMNDKIDYAQKLVNRLWEIEDILSDTNYKRLSGRVDELIEELEDACAKRFSEEYDACDEEEYQLEEWLSYLSDDKSDCYIDDDFKMYEVITIKKEYA